jgi:hypothetical protein
MPSVVIRQIRCREALSPNHHEDRTRLAGGLPAVPRPAENTRLEGKNAR